MLTTSDNNFVDGYVIKDFPLVHAPKAIEKNGNENGVAIKQAVVKPTSYLYVHPGFFKLVPFPTLTLYVIAHILHMYGYYLILSQCLWKTMMISTIFIYWSGIGAMAGSHRLWCHRGYSAKLPLRIFLMIGQTMSGQFTIFKWAAGHRTHHKYSDTDADPHNVRRGFMFSHMGWTVMREHPMVEIKGSTIDFSDLLADPVVRIQKDYYNWFYLAFTVALPTAVPMITHGESFLNAFVVCFIMRFLIVLHGTWFINSAAHMFGDRPYSDKIPARENFWFSYSAYGEGYHNYHHAYPWDYGAGEVGNYFNATKKFIDLMAFFGQAYNLKQASRDVIGKSRQRVISNNQLKAINKLQVEEDDPDVAKAWTNDRS